jgi:hypothetical protein
MGCRQRRRGVIRSVVIGLAFSASLAAPAAAQHLVPVGARVAVVIDEDRRQASNRIGPKVATLRGEVTAETTDSLWIRMRVTGSLGIAKAGIRNLSVSRGPPSRGRSLILEGLGGAIVGAIQGAIFYHAFGTNSSMFGAKSRGESAANGAAYGAAIFGGIGFIWPVEYWRPIPLD